MRFLLRLLLNGVAIVVAANVITGLHLNGYVAALIAGAVLGLVNAVIRPVLKILTFPITILTLGLFTLVINAVCFALTAAVVDGFEIDGAVPAFLGALLVTFVSWALSLVLVPKKEKS
jgi:putative membrane protein